MKAMWNDNACEFKKSADQVADPEARLNLLSATFTGPLTPPGYKVSSESKSSLGADKQAKFSITGPSGLFYELEITKGSDGKVKSASEKPDNCS